MDFNSVPKNFLDLLPEEKDLTMFTIQSLDLFKNAEQVMMTMKLKRKVTTELLTTYLPTILLLLITFASIFFERELFGEAIAVNLTIMLVMTTIFTSKIEELPPTSDMKMIDIWLIFCLIVPFIEVVISTAIEYVNCTCDICEPADAPVIGEGAIQVQQAGNKDPVKIDDIVKVVPKQVTRQRKAWEAVDEKCWRGWTQNVLLVVGEIFNAFQHPMKVVYNYHKNQPKYFSEIWIMPSIILLTVGAYSLVAYVFYNQDG